MDVVRGWRDVPASAQGAVFAIGNFDGVHRGHQAVLREARRLADSEGKRAGAVVFDPHPREFFEPGRPFFHLTPLPLKLELLAALGLDQTVVIPFDQDLASLSADAFARDVLAGGLRAAHVVVGYDFTYGKGRTGSTEELARLGSSLGYGVDVVAPIGSGGITFSSSQVRQHLREGAMQEAAIQLGYWWRVRDVVASGAGRGKGLGFPTANIPLDDGQDVERGIYALRVVHGGRRYHAAGYVGSSPTFGDGPVTLEAYLLDFEGDLYDAEIEVEFIAQLRGDETFVSPDALAAQMQKDCVHARDVLTEIEADDPIRHFPVQRALNEALLD
jgi:riboflavin kinase/FMN adenylyltransferase